MECRKEADIWLFKNVIECAQNILQKSWKKKILECPVTSYLLNMPVRYINPMSVNRKQFLWRITECSSCSSFPFDNVLHKTTFCWNGFFQQSIYVPYYDVCIRFQSPRHKLSLTSLRLSSLLSNMLWSSLLTIHSNIHFGTKNLYFIVESFSSKVFVQINIDRIFLGKMVGCLFIPKGDIEILIYQNIWY